jgi:O-antigen ligase/Flp pilus assembly protein TadD
MTPAGGARFLVLGTLLVPILVAPGFFFPYVTTRAVYFRVLVELAFSILMYLVIRRDVTLHVRRDAAFWALTAWITANALAAAFGAAPMRSIFGDHERMGGVWFWVHLFAYYVILRTFLRPDDWWRFFRIGVGVAAAIAAVGLIQHWFDPQSFGIARLRTGVTIGNSGLMAGYLLANVALAVLLATRSAIRGRIGYGAIALLLIVAIMFSGNRSSTLALLVGGGMTSLAYAIWTGSLTRWRGLMITALFTSALALPFISATRWARPITSRVPVLSRLSAGVDSTRVIQWRAAAEGIRSRPLLGVGPENYQLVWSSFNHPEMYRFIGDMRWDRAHNAYLDAFATAGVLGFLSLLAVFLALGWSARQAAQRSAHGNDATSSRSPPVAMEAIAIGFFAAYAIYLFFWFFDLNSAMLWIALAAFVASRATGCPLLEIGARREKRLQSSVVLGLGLIALVALLYVHGFETLRMARNLDRAQNPSLTPAQVLNVYQSVFGSPAPATQHVFPMYAGHLATFRSRFQEIRSDAASAALFDRAFVLAIEEFERQAVRDPLNERIAVQHARVLILGAYYYNNGRLYESALAKLHRAVELAPRRITTRLVLGTAYLNVSQPERALEIFRQAYDLYPPLGQTHAYLASAHARLGRYDSAATWLRSAIANGYSPDGALVRSVARELLAVGKADAGASLTWEYLRGNAGTPFLWAAGVGEPSADKSELAALAADLFSAAGQPAKAAVIRGAAPALCTRPMPLASLAAAALDRERVEHAPDCREPWRLAAAF